MSLPQGMNLCISSNFIEGVIFEKLSIFEHGRKNILQHCGDQIIIAFTASTYQNCSSQRIALWPEEQDNSTVGCTLCIKMHQLTDCWHSLPQVSVIDCLPTWKITLLSPIMCYHWALFTLSTHSMASYWSNLIS